MTNVTKTSAKRVQEYLRSYDFDFTVKEFQESTRTALDAANAIGCEVSQIAKSLIFRDKKSNTPVLVVASGANMVCTRKIEKAMGVKLGKADADFVREHTGYAIGGVPPIAHKEKIMTVLDADLQQVETIWAAAGTPNAMFALQASQLANLTDGEWIELKQ